MPDWSKWLPFAGPRAHGIISAPFGPGVYEVRHASGSRQLVLFGIGGHVAWRFTSLLPAKYGKGTRNNKDRRNHCLAHIADLEYHTIATTTRGEAAKIERKTKIERGAEYLLKT